jgi:hypothetical protein
MQCNVSRIELKTYMDAHTHTHTTMHIYEKNALL